VSSYEHLQLCFTNSSQLRSQKVLETLTNALINHGFRPGSGVGECDPEQHFWFAHLYKQGEDGYQAPG